MNWVSIISYISLPTSLYGIYELIMKARVWVEGCRRKTVVWNKSKDWVIITPRYTGNYRRVEDILSTEEISAHCRTLGFSIRAQDNTEAIPDGKNLIFVCGPVANKATQEYYRYFHLNVISSNGDCVIRDSIGNCEYTTVYDDADHLIKTDFAVISRYYHEDYKRTYIFCFGLHGVGTIGAARALVSSELLKYLKKNQNFEALISVPVINDRFSIGPINFVIPPRTFQ